MAAESVGQIALDMSVNEKGFNKQINNMGKNAQSVIGGAFKKIGAIVAAGLAVKKVAEFGSECLKLGSDLQEVQNVVDVTFKTMNKEVNAFAQTAITQFGLSETVAKKYMGTFGAMSKSFGFAEKDAFAMSKALTGLAGDVASFYNLTSDEAYTKLKSVYTGETESLKDLGVVMTQSALDAYAMANGYGKAVSKMTEAEKVALRFAFVQEKLSAASGDFVRTGDGWANQIRVMKLQWQSFMANIGMGLINLFTPLLKWLNVIMEKLVKLSRAFKSFTEVITGKKTQDAVEGLGDITGVPEDVTGSVDNLGDSAVETAKKIKNSVMGFDQLNRLDPPDEEGSDSGGGSPGIDSGAVGGLNGAMGDLATETDKANDSVKRLIGEAIRLKDIFKTGFEMGLNGANFDAIKEHVKGIGESLKNIFTDQDVLNAGKKFVDTFVLNAGKIVGSMASIGMTAMEFFVGSIDKFLQQQKSVIKNWIIRCFDVSAEIVSLVGDFAVGLASIFTVFKSDTAKQIGADLINIFATPFMTVIELALKFGRDLIGCIVNPILENKEKIKEAITNTLEPIGVVTGAISKLVTDLMLNIMATYDTYLKPAFENISEGFSKILGSILDAYNHYIAPVFDKIGAKIAEVIDGNVKPMFEKFFEVIGKLCFLISELFNHYFAPFIDWLGTSVVPVLTPIVEWIGVKLVEAFGFLCDAVTLVLDWLSKFISWCTDNQGIIMTITGIVSGFFAAWELIKIMAFIEQAGGLITVIGNIGTALFLGAVEIWGQVTAWGALLVAKVMDKIETIVLTIMYAGEFLMSIVTGTGALIAQVVQWGIVTFAKIADIIQTWLMIAATTAWNIICGIATAVTAGFAAVMAFLTSPIGLVVLAIVAVIAIGALLVANWDWICQKATELGAWISGKWDELCTNVSGAVDTAKTWVSEKWDELCTNVSNASESTKNWVLEKWEGIKQGANDVMTRMFPEQMETWNRLKEECGGSANALKEVSNKAFSEIQNKLGEVGNFVQTVFQNAWDNTFGAIGNFVTSTFDNIVNTIRSSVNSAIDIANSAISKVNGLKVDVPNWVPGLGGKSFGVNVPSIPKLATGGYVKANTPQLAMIGDNKTQGEIVSPEGKMMEVMMAALGKFAGQTKGSGGQGAQLPDNLTLNISLGADDFVDLVINGINDRSRRQGKSVIINTGRG